MIIPFISQLSAEQQQVWIEQLNSALPQVKIVQSEQIAATERDLCQLAIVANPKPEIVAQFKNLKWLQSLWAGVEGLTKAFQRSNFEIVRLIDPFLAQTMAEAVLAWALYLHRDMPRYRQQQNEQLWLQHPYKSAIEKQITVLGLGELGQASAELLAKNNFKVAGWSRTKKEIASIETFAGEKALPKAVFNADIIVCLLPFTPETERLVNAELIGKMPKGAAIINFARGGILDTEALVTALNTRHLSHAVLDVFEQEPLPANNPLWQHPNITVLPHISASTNISTATKIVANNINHFVQSGIIPKGIDKSLGY